MTTTCGFLVLLGALATAQSATISPSSSTAPPTAGGSDLPGLGPALSPRITQEDVESGAFTLKELRAEGQRIFATPFNKFDGMGDGPVDASDPTRFGGRPTIGGNGTWLRANGLDSQSCVECHFVLNNRDIPTTFAVGGVGGIAASAMPGLVNFDIGDADATGIAEHDGRKINPPFLWGSGGVELLAKEMTMDLQALKAAAQLNPDVPVSLVTKGIDFGTLVYDSSSQDFDTSGVEGVDGDLVVRPFGRKGDNMSVREFDIGALQFHHGMQPAEVFGDGVDEDGDGVADEILSGELSALHVYSVASTRPRRIFKGTPQSLNGEQLFQIIGCAECHVPTLHTDSNTLDVAFPEVPTDPTANVYMSIQLLGGSASFKNSNVSTGVRVDLFSDLKRHDVGTSDPNGSPLANVFITPRLWGVADTAPYMHDGRALTITEAILAHGVEGQAARDAFAALDQASQVDLLTYLDTLRAPSDPNNDL